MFDILGKVGAFFVGVGAAITTLVFPVNTPTTAEEFQVKINDLSNQIALLTEQLNKQEQLGAGVVQAQKFKLSGSGISATAVTIGLQSFKFADNATNIAIADFQGGVGYGTLEPGTSREEQVQFTGVTQNADGTASLTTVTRGLTFSGADCTTSSTLGKAHAGGTIFIISNTACFYSNFPSKSETSTITALWRFPSSTARMARVDATSSLTGASATILVWKEYVDTVASSGAADADTTTKGIIEIATGAELASSTAAGGTSASLVPRSTSFSATSSAANVVPVVQNANGLNSVFINQTSTYAWTGAHTFATSTIFNGSSTFNATTTFNANVVFATGSLASSSIPKLSATRASSSAGTTSTASTVFTPIDGASATLTTGANRAFVSATGDMQCGAASVEGYLDIFLDGTSLSNASTGIWQFVYDVNSMKPFTVNWLTDALTAGSHTFVLRVKIQDAAKTCTIGRGVNNPPLVLNVFEMYN